MKINIKWTPEYKIVFALLAVLVAPFLMISIILWDGFWFQQIWNLLMPRFGLFEIPLTLAIAINLIIGYQKINGIKAKETKFDWGAVFVSPIILWIAAFVLSKYI
jgi:hypothetical protein